jgi:hypothetical protein
MKPKQRITRVKTSEAEIDEKAKEILSKTKTHLIDTESSNKDIEKALTADEEIPASEKMMNTERTTQTRSSRKTKTGTDKLSTEKPMLGEEIYSEDLILQSQLGTEEPQKQVTEREEKEKNFNELFCEETFRRRILKKIFRKDENFFKDFVYSLTNEENWEDAAKKIDEMFSNKKINYFSNEAVKFVDVMQSYFIKDPESTNNSDGTD